MSTAEDARRDGRLADRMRRLSAGDQTTRGRDAAWATLSRLGSQATSFVTVVVLARILDPTAFGVVAIAQVFLGFAWLFSDLGLGAALVRTERLSGVLLTTVFWANTATGVVLALALTGLSFPLAAAYHQPRLVLILAITGLQIACNLTVVPLALLERAFRFRLLAAVEISCGLVSAAVSITAAVLSAGAVSIVLGPVVAVIVQGTVLWSVVRIPPGVRPSKDAARQLRSFSGPIVAFNMMLYWARNIDNLLLGILAGAAELGLYSRAYSLMLVPVQQVTVVLGRVLLPTLSRHQTSLDSLRRAYLRALRLSSAVTIPVGVGMTCLCAPVISVVFGPHWSSAALLLGLLASTTPVQVIVATTGPIYQALGNTHQWSRRASITAFTTMVALCLGAIWGAVGVSVAYAVSTFGLTVYAVRQPWDLIGLGLAEGFLIVRTPLIAGIGLACTLVALQILLSELPALVVLAIAGSVGVGVYLVLIWLLDPDLIRDWKTAIVARRT